MRRLALVLLLGLASIAFVASASAQAQPPAAPTDLRIDGGTLAWNDNSDNEDGFRIRLSIGGGPQEVLATLPPDTTSAAIPAGPTPTTPVDPCAPRGFSVVAFNDAGESAPSNAVGVFVTDCDGFGEPTAVSGPAFPDTGQGSSGGLWWFPIVIILAAASIALLLLAWTRRDPARSA